jgi:hypothetical protein
MSTVVIIGGGGGGGSSNRTLSVQDDGTVVDANGTTVAHFVSVAAAIAYLQSLEAAGLSAAAPAEGMCSICGEPMPEGERMFKYHGYSGPCPAKA